MKNDIFVAILKDSHNSIATKNKKKICEFVGICTKTLSRNMKDYYETERFIIVRSNYLKAR